MAPNTDARSDYVPFKTAEACESVIDQRTAHEIWTVLVAECGASETLREHFVDSMAARTGSAGEWRFCGALGFGGKFWWDLRPLRPGRATFRVSCYGEDETPERRMMIGRANARLAELGRLP